MTLILRYRTLLINTNWINSAGQYGYLKHITTEELCSIRNCVIL